MLPNLSVSATTPFSYNCNDISVHGRIKKLVPVIHNKCGALLLITSNRLLKDLASNFAPKESTLSRGTYKADGDKDRFGRRFEGLIKEGGILEDLTKFDLIKRG